MSEEKKKRVADRQITKDDAPVEDEDNEEVKVLTEVPKADRETLQKRKIVKVARKQDGSLDFSKKKTNNPFASVALQAKTTTTKESSSSSSSSEKPSAIFGSTAGFSGFGAVSTNNGNGFGTVKSNNNSNPPTLSFGTAKGFGSLSAASNNNNTGFSGFANTTKTETSTDEKDKDKSTDKESSTKNPTDNTPSTSTSTTTATATFTFAPSSNTTPKKTEETTAVLLPTDYKLQSGEENEQILMEVRCKTHRWAPDDDAQHSKQMTTQQDNNNANESVPPTQLSFNNAKDDASKHDTTTTSTESEAKSNKETQSAKENTDKPAKKSTSTSTSEAVSDAAPPKMSWHEVGVGPLRVLQTKPTNKSSDSTSTSEKLSKSSTMRLVQRRQVDPSAAVTKVLLNVHVWKESTISQPSEKHVQFTSPPNTMFLFKCGKAETAAHLTKLLKTAVNQQPSCFQQAQDDTQEANTPESTDTA